MITQKDIARRLGLSTSLVSRALQGSAAKIGVSAATIARIRAEARRLNYRPSLTALALRGASTRTLGVIVKDFADPFFGQMLGELQRRAAAREFSLVVTGRGTGPAAVDPLAGLTKYRLDGLFLLGSCFDPGDLSPWANQGVPIVQIGAGAAPAVGCSVCLDDAAGLAQLVAHLGELGHRAFGFLGSPEASHQRRAELLRRCLRRAGLPARPVVFPRPADVARHGPRSGMTALIAADDMLALAALRALHEAGVRVPADLSVVGVDDIAAAALVVPALTTVRQPVAAMIEQAFAWLMQPRRGRRPRTAAPIAVAPELVVRESCGRPRGAMTKRGGL